MNILQSIQKKAVTKRVPIIRAGYTVRVHQKIKEGEKERIQIYEGLVIAVNSGYGADKTFTVRKVVGGIGVEKIFPVYSSAIEKIEIKKKSKVRRAKLYYMRERFGKSARLKEEFVSAEELEQMYEELAQEEAEKEAEESEDDEGVPTEAEQPAESKDEAPKTEEAPAEEPEAEEKAKEEDKPEEEAEKE